MKSVLLLIMFLVLSPSLIAQEKKIYVTKDANGVLIFSDSPKAGAEQLTLSNKINIMEATKITPSSGKAIEAEPYSLEIVEPEEEATVRDNTGSVYITGKITPMFQRGLRVRAILDGKPQGEPQSNAVFILRDVDRGEHKLQLELFDPSGKIIATSPTRTFFLHRTSVISPK